MSSDTTNAPTPKRKRARRDRKVRDPLRRSPDSSPSAIARRKGVVCPRCDKHHVRPDGKPSCNGHQRGVRPYQPCGRRPTPGAAVCILHGSRTPQVASKAALRVEFAKQEGQVAALLRECDLPEQHPIDGLLEVVRHTGAMMRLLGSLVAQLDLEPGEVKIAITDSGDVTKYTTDDAIHGYNHMGDQAPHVLLLLYGMWADRYGRACKLALDANIDERLVRNAESTSDAVFQAVTVALEKANLTPVQSAEFSKTLAAELRKLVGPIEQMERRI